MLATIALQCATDINFDSVQPLLSDEELDMQLPFAQHQPLAEAVRYPAVHQAMPPAQAPIAAILEKLEPERVRIMIERMFNDLTRLLGYLGWIEADLRQDSSLQEALPKFTLIKGEALTLLDFIATQALENTDLPASVSVALDDIIYIIKHELRRVFTCELDTLSDLQFKPLIRANVEHAHGILSNCFQQATVSLARVFDPSLEAACLFNDVKIRREQSLALYRDLIAIAHLVRRTEEGHDANLYSQLLANLKTFSQGSMRYLMFKDWSPFERIIRELSETSSGTSECSYILHRFSCYLETLHAHVGMRAVLAEHQDMMHTEPELAKTTIDISINSYVK